MKYFFVFLCILLSGNGWGQPVPPLHFIPSDGTELAKYWKWKPGDQPSWAAPDFDDNQWEKFTPGKSIHRLPTLQKTQIAWFRRRVRVDSSLVNKVLFVNIEQTGASEIYLDGKLLHKIGVVSTDPAVELTRTKARFLPLNFADTLQHVIAVRFSVTQSNFYFVGSNTDVFEFRIFDLKNISNHSELLETGLMGALIFCIGIFLVFSILHFSFYVSNRGQKVSFWLGFTMLFFTFSFVADLAEDFPLNVTAQQIASLLNLVFFYSGLLLINVSLYIYLSQPFRLFFYIQAGLILLGFLGMFIDFHLPYGLAIIWFPIPLIFVDFVRVSILAERRRNPNARVPLYSLLAAALGFVAIFIFAILFGTLIDTQTILEGYAELFAVFMVLMFILISICIPVGLSFSLVKEYSRTHQSLRKKLQEIEMLSAKNLAQEQEKQHLLAAQNEMLEQQVAERTAELHDSIEHLKTTQEQLIQSEKLASLGELTAGIAHEIQNPLNFVNNFSEVSVELLDELKEERDKRLKAKYTQPNEESSEEEILNDIVQNLQKINHHGKRAASIVTGMLQHSRASTGKKEPTDINALADEYFRLSYHGLRAKDKSFNAKTLTDLDPNLPKAEVIPQDLGRVLLNLINNAFYAVQKKQQAQPEAADLTALPTYEPTVWVTTRKTDDHIVITVRDNGTGIPEEVRSKIFQPFFTTKPTGQGTGLGLSLAYDIITKGHGGTLEVESTEGEGTAFVVKLLID